jgi:hypothetical protein
MGNVMVNDYETGYSEGHFDGFTGNAHRDPRPDEPLNAFQVGYDEGYYDGQNDYRRTLS